jgi:hypothetical protein
MRVKAEVPLGKLEIWACEWEDAHWNSGEMAAEEWEHGPTNYVTVGILLKDDEVGFSTATDINEGGTFRGINFIPAKMIVRKWKVGALKPKIRKVRVVRSNVVPEPLDSPKPQ